MQARLLFFVAACALASCTPHDNFRFIKPTPSPTQSPSGAPSVPPVVPPVVPSVASVALAGAGSAATITVTQSGYNGSFSARTSNAAIATVAPGPSGQTFVITAGSTPGSATITISGAPGGPAGVVTAVVTITQGVAQ